MSKWMPRKLIIFLMVVGYCTPIFGKDLGKMGQVFPIEEESFLLFLQRSLAGKDLNQKISQAKESLMEQAKTPTPVEKVQVAKKSRTFLVDLSFKVEKDIQDTAGTVIAKAGTIINPLKQIKLSSALLFLDGSKESHLAWARKQTGHFKWILTRGKPIEIEEREKCPIYFDQNGVYTSRFKITHIPAKVVQKEGYLLVEEFALPEREKAS